MKLPHELLDFCTIFENSGYEIFLVGGAVRNLLMNIAPKDFDFATNAKPEEVQSLFKKTIPTGIQHGTITVLYKKFSFEVTTYRIDGDYENHRSPNDVIFTSDLKEDLSRRDFTVNAIAYSPTKGQIFDPFDGQKDIKNLIIRTVGTPQKRFSEDALRILRAIRFSTQMNAKIEAETLQAVMNEAHSLEKISRERLRDEFLKILISKQALKGIELLYNSKIIRIIYPNIIENLDHDFSRFEDSIADIENRLSIFCLIAVLWDDLETFLRSLKLSNSLIKLVIQSYSFAKNQEFSNLSEYAIRKVLSVCGSDNFHTIINSISWYSKLPKDLELRALEIFKSNPPVSLKQLEINGDTLYKAFGIERGPLMGNYLALCLEEVLKNPSLNTKDALSDLIKREIEAK